LILDITAEAKADLRAIYAYSVEHWGKAKADAYLDTIQAKLRALAGSSLSGVPADEVRPGLRRQLAGSHTIWFRIESDRLKVIRVLHQSRETGLWLG
jgi:toxin ParE1/3/4